MHRIRKFLWMIFILWFVFFIICDENWIKIKREKNHIVLHKTENISDNKKPTKKILKNSDIVRIYPGFENPKNLRASNGVDLEYLAKLEEERKAQEKVYTWPSLISMNDDTISSVFQREPVEEIITPEPQKTQEPQKIEEIQKTEEVQNNTEISTKEETVIENKISEPQKTDNLWEEEIAWFVIKDTESDSHVDTEQENKSESLDQNEWTTIPAEDSDKVLYKNSNLIKIYPGFENPKKLRNSAGINEEFLKQQENETDTDTQQETEIKETQNEINDTESSTTEKSEPIIQPELTWNQESIQPEPEITNENSQTDKEETKTESNPKEVEPNLTKIERPDLSTYSVDLSKWKEPVVHTTKIEKYNHDRQVLLPKKGILVVKQTFVVENNEEETPSNWLSDPMIESLLANEEIDIDVLESENDEFLQKVFDTTRDTSVMNLIVENYLNEYQFVKAKKFIENLPIEYREDLNVQLNLRVMFNSFALTSKTITETLTSLVQDYVSKNKISDEDKKRYLWVIALMDRDYDKFFDIAEWFTSEKNKAFTSKLQWYRDQIAKQMWMPEYYFDTLVSLELFNQWLFQPAKVLALYSLQQNQNYILPYQILAYANFLTNSRDTSAEYLRKLIDIDPNNAEKYRFLMWIAFYWDEKYQQSVIMLSLIKDEKLRLDAERYLIRDYIHLDQKNKLLSVWNRILWYDNLVASDFYTYFYEAFYRPFSEWAEYKVYRTDAELANKMIRVCSMKLPEEEKAVCNYWMIGKNIASWEFDGLESSLLNLVAQYPQWYLYQALWEYYLKQWDLDKAKAYLLKAVSMTKNVSEVIQIKKLLENTM